MLRHRGNDDASRNHASGVVRLSQTGRASSVRRAGTSRWRHEALAHWSYASLRLIGKSVLAAGTTAILLADSGTPQNFGTSLRNHDPTTRRRWQTQRPERPTISRQPTFTSILPAHMRIQKKTRDGKTWKGCMTRTWKTYGTRPRRTIKAIALQPRRKDRAREMISGQAEEDTLLTEMALDDARFRTLVGLPAARAGENPKSYVATLVIGQVSRRQSIASSECCPLFVRPQRATGAR